VGWTAAGLISEVVKLGGQSSVILGYLGVLQTETPSHMAGSIHLSVESCGGVSFWHWQASSALVSAGLNQCGGIRSAVQWQFRSGLLCWRHGWRAGGEGGRGEGCGGAGDRHYSHRAVT
jgi:hypothetical protein